MQTARLLSPAHPTAATANAAFKARYPRTLEVALLVALSCHVLLTVTVPPITIEPRSVPEDPFVVVDLPPEIRVQPEPEEVALPRLPTEMEITDDANLEETIPWTATNPFARSAIPEDAGSGGFLVFDTEPVAIRKVVPAYPELARAAGAEGTVWVQVTIDTKGRVIAARVVKSDTIARLEEAALKAAMDWLFTPGKQRDVPVPARIAVPFEFHLH